MIFSEKKKTKVGLPELIIVMVVIGLFSSLSSTSLLSEYSSNASNRKRRGSLLEPLAVGAFYGLRKITYKIPLKKGIGNCSEKLILRYKRKNLFRGKNQTQENKICGVLLKNSKNVRRSVNL